VTLEQDVIEMKRSRDALVRMAFGTIAEIESLHPKPWHLTEYRNGVFFDDAKGVFITQPTIKRFIEAADLIIEHG
jgi:hypothetical protein